MKKLLANLLADAFSAIGGAASVAALPMCAGPAIPAAFAAAALLAIVYKYYSGASNDARLEEKIDAVLYGINADRRDAEELIRVAGLPTDGVGASENSLTLLYAAIQKEIRQNAQPTTDMSDRLEQLLEKNASLAERLSTALGDESNGLKELLVERDACAERKLHELANALREVHTRTADELCKRLFYPRLSLPLRAYTLDGSAARRLYHGCRRVKCVGRDEQFAHLHEFLRPRDGAQHDLSWWLWTGRAGVGKSRLALELCLQAIQLGYRAGFWERNDEFTEWDKWTVDKPSLVVIDYVAERAPEIRKGILRLYRDPSRIRRHLRLLLLERSADEQLDGWYRDFWNARSLGDRLDLEDCRYADPVRCSGLDDSAIRAVFDEIFSESHFSGSPAHVLPLYRELDPEGRPLLAAAAAEAIVHGGSIERIRDWSSMDLVKSIVNREIEAWCAAGIDEAHVNLAAYATIRGGCKASDCNELAAKGFDIPRWADRNVRWLHQLSSFGAARDADEIPPIVPDMLGEWFVLERLTGRLDVGAPNDERVARTTAGLLEHAWNIDEGVRDVIVRAVSDFPMHDAIPSLLCDDLATRHPGSYVIIVGNAVAAIVKKGSTDLAQHLIDQVRYLAAQMPHDDLIAEGLRGAYYNCGVAYTGLGEFTKAIDAYTRSMSIPGSTPGFMAMALNNRAIAYRTIGENARGIDDYTRAIELPGVPLHQSLKALINRGIAHGEMGEARSQIDDCTQVIEFPAAPPDLVAMAYFNRGNARHRAGDYSSAIDDYSRAIELTGATSEVYARALLGRSGSHWAARDYVQAINDLSRVVDLPDTPPAMTADALYNRGIARGHAGDAVGALGDFTRVVASPSAPPTLVAKTLVNRGIIYQRIGDESRAFEDYGRGIDMSVVAPDENLKALVNRAGILHRQGDHVGAIEDYSRALSFHDVSPEMTARLHCDRGGVFYAMQELDRAIEDYDIAIQSPGATPDAVARAHVGRAAVYGDRGDNAREIDEYTIAIETAGATPEVVAAALGNRALADRRNGEYARAIQDYSRAIELEGVPTEILARFLYGRGASYSKKNESAMAIEDFRRVVDLPGAPPEFVSRALLEAVCLGEYENEQCHRLAQARDLAQISKLPNLLERIQLLAEELGCTDE